MSDEKNTYENFRDISMRLLKEGKEPKDVIKNIEDMLETEIEDDKLEDEIEIELRNMPENLNKKSGDNLMQPLHEHPQHNNMMIMYGYIKSESPSWTKEFGIENQHAEELKLQRPYCLLFVKFKTNDADVIQDSEINYRWMVIPKGCGHQLLKLEELIYGFGLYITLNIIDLKNITRLGVKVIGSGVQNFHGISPRGCTINDFRMDIMDILKKAGGKVMKDEEDENIEISVAGSDMLKVRFKSSINLNSLTEICEKYYNQFQEKQRKIPFLFGYEQIMDKKMIETFEKRLVESIQLYMKEEDDRVSLAYPFTKKDIVEGNVKFMGFGGKQKTVYDELSLENYLIEIKKDETVKKIFEDKETEEYSNKIIDLLNKHVVKLRDENGSPVPCSIIKCLSFSTEKDGDQFLLQDGNWYKVNSDQIQKLKEFFDEKCRKQATLPPYNEHQLVDVIIPQNVKKSKKEIKTKRKSKKDMVPPLDDDGLGENKKDANKKEAKYNESVANNDNYLCLDRRLIYVGEGKERGDNKFEVCDLLSKNGELIHVKFRGYTGDQGYLFNQGVISARFMHNNKKIRDDIYELIRKEALEKAKRKSMEMEKCKEERAEKVDEAAQEESKVMIKEEEGINNDEKEGDDFMAVMKKSNTEKSSLTVVFAIIANENNRILRLPALILFYYATRRIEGLGYKVEFEWITDSTKTKPKKTITTKKTEDDSGFEIDSSVTDSVLTIPPSQEFATCCANMDSQIISSSVPQASGDVSESVSSVTQQIELPSFKRKNSNSPLPDPKRMNN